MKLEFRVVGFYSDIVLLRVDYINLFWLSKFNFEVILLVNYNIIKFVSYNVKKL